MFAKRVSHNLCERKSLSDRSNNVKYVGSALRIAGACFLYPKASAKYSSRKSFFDFARWNSANVAVSYLYFTLVMIDFGSGQSIFGKLINGYDVRYRRTKRRRVIYQLYILISGNHPCV